MAYDLSTFKKNFLPKEYCGKQVHYINGTLPVKHGIDDVRVIGYATSGRLAEEINTFKRQHPRLRNSISPDYNCIGFAFGIAEWVTGFIEDYVNYREEVRDWIQSLSRTYAADHFPDRHPLLSNVDNMKIYNAKVAHLPSYDPVLRIDKAKNYKNFPTTVLPLKVFIGSDTIHETSDNTYKEYTPVVNDIALFRSKDGIISHAALYTDKLDDLIGFTSQDDNFLGPRWVSKLGQGDLLAVSLQRLDKLYPYRYRPRKNTFLAHYNLNFSEHEIKLFLKNKIGDAINQIRTIHRSDYGDLAFIIKQG